MERTQTFDCFFFQLKCGDALMEDCEHSGYCSSCCTDKNVEKFAKLSTKTSDIKFCNSLAG